MKKNNLYQNIILTILSISLVVIAVMQVLQFRKETAVKLKGEYQFNCEEKADSSSQPFLSGDKTAYSGKQNCTIKQK
jgi:hypothetical protein